MSECTHDCSSCGESCASREPQSLLKAHHADAHVGKVYGIVSGKGGVGKSMVTSQLAVTMRRRGYQVGILDADITGPSIPKAFGIHDRAMGTENALIPSESKTGIQVMSINLLLENETDPVIWRGPSFPVWSSSSGRMFCGTATICLWICLPEPATCPCPCSSPSRWTASSSWPPPKIWWAWW